MGQREFKKWIASLISVVMVLAPLQALGANKQTIYRNEGTSPTYGLCNPSEYRNLNAPFAHHAPCLDKEMGGEIQRYYQYDENGDRKGVIEGSDHTAAPTVVIEYSVNRKVKSISTNGIATRFFYTATGEKLAVYDEGTGNTHIHAETFLEFENDEAQIRYGEDVKEVEAATMLFSLKDQVGSVLATVQVSGVDQRRDYLPFGKNWYRDGVQTDVAGFNGTREEAGVMDYNARHYDGENFLQADSMVPDPGQSISYNRYAYTNQNPMKYRDDTGHFPVLIAALVGGLLSALAHKDSIQNFGDFMSFFAAGAIGGAAPGLGSALGATMGSAVAGAAVAGATSSLFSNALVYQVYGADYNSHAMFSSMLSGAAGSALSVGMQSGLKDLKGFSYAMGRGSQAMLGQMTTATIYQAFGYNSSLSGQTIGSAFGSAFVSGLVEGSMESSTFAEQSGDSSLYKMKDGALGNSLASSFLGDLAGAIIGGRMSDSDGMMVSFANSAGSGINNHVFKAAAIDQTNQMIMHQTLEAGYQEYKNQKAQLAYGNL